MQEALRQAVEANSPRVAVAGGDGTLHHAAQILAGTATALAIVPLGTGNDLARVTGTPLDPVQALDRAIESSTIRRIDVARTSAGRIFVEIAGTGVDGDVLDFLTERPRWLRGPAIYPYAVLRTLGAFEPPELTLEHDDGTFRGEVMLIAVANGPLYGGGMQVAPEARIDDGLLDIVIVRRMPKWRAALLFPQVYRGTHIRDPAVQVIRTRRLRLSSNRPRRFNVDGERLGTLDAQPLEIEVVPQGLGVVS